MAKLSIGIDLSGRTIANSAPTGLTIPSGKIVAATHNMSSIIEIEGGAYYHVQGGENVYFYDSETNLESFTLPDNFGIINWVDKTSVFYQYLSRSDNEKMYLISEDASKMPVIVGTDEMEEGDPLPTGQIYIQFDE